MAELQRGNLAYRYRAGGLHAGHGNGIVFEEIVFKYLRGMSGAHAGGVEKTLQRIRLYMVLRTGRQQCLGRPRFRPRLANRDKAVYCWIGFFNMGQS